MQRLNNFTCMDIFDFPERKEGTFDCILSDPPYMINYKGEVSDTSWDTSSSEEETIFYFQRVLEKCFFLLKEQGRVIFFNGISNLKNIINIAKDVGFEIDLKEDWYTWIKLKGRGSQYKLKNLREEILILRKGGDRLDNKDTLKVFNFKPVKIQDVDSLLKKDIPFPKNAKTLFFNSPFVMKHVTDIIKEDYCFHSCQKPIGLILYLLDRFSTEGDYILDMFAGSNRGGIASNILERHSFSVEKDEKMYKQSLEITEKYNYKSVSWLKENRGFLF